MPHPSEHGDALAPLDAGEAEQLAEAISAFAAPSRLRLLYALAAGERSVESLIAATGLGPTVVSQQLRVLRQLRTVTVRREGRRAYYRLHDHHIGDMLAAIRHHGEHRAVFGRPGGPVADADPVEAPPGRTEAA
jgi:DNA-binding transcriptional ArsR family regulator